MHVCPPLTLTLTRSVKVSCRTLQRRIILPKPDMRGPFAFAQSWPIHLLFLFLENYSISGAQIVAENHRKPQNLAENRSTRLSPSDCKRGRREGATSKNVKNRQKCQKVFRHFSTIFARHHFSGPFWGALQLVLV